MNVYIGTKVVRARPMSRQAYNDLRGWQVPDDENPADEGYLVEYEGSESNHPDFKGYISWSPKKVFEGTYKKNGSLSFGHAVELLKQGKRVARKGWNGKGMFLLLIAGETVRYSINQVYGDGYLDSVGFSVLDAIYMKTADDKLVAWLASQTDILSEDWQVV